jgi:hypothetical protein
MTMATTAAPTSPAAAAPKTTRRARNSAAMPRPVRARAAASAAAAARQRASRPASAANAQPAAVNPRIAWAGNGHNTTARSSSSAAQDHGLTLHDTLYSDSRGAVHYRSAEDPRGDRRAVLGALRSMELEEAAFIASSEHGSAGSGGMASGRVAKASGGSGRRAPWEGAGHAARQRLEPRKFLRGAKAVKHTHMVDQPARRGGVKA